MLALKIDGTEIKKFMNSLLIENTFDEFEFREAVISSFVRFEIDGKPPAGTPDEEKKYSPWTEVKPYIFNIIKGKTKPRQMKFVFSYPYEKTEEFNAQAKALFLNILFENEAVLITSGCQTKVFTLDKGVESAWDSYVKSFFVLKGTAFAEV